jgi:hypothetical protein
MEFQSSASSLGIRTDMLFHRFDGVVIERDGYIVVRIPIIAGEFIQKPS